MENQSLRILFLRSFVKSLISNIKPTSPSLSKITNKQEIVLEDYTPKSENYQESQSEEGNYISLPTLPSMPILPSIPAIPHISQISNNIIKGVSSPSSLRVNFPQNLSVEQKILFFLKDPSVTGVECPGPGKNVLINKSGRIQPVSLTISKESINNFMSSISEQTKIPLIPGIFKAVLNNLIITAVLSDYVGTRFIIQKRSPF